MRKRRIGAGETNCYKNPRSSDCESLQPTLFGAFAVSFHAARSCAGPSYTPYRSPTYPDPIGETAVPAFPGVPSLREVLR
jgi:hypothetical protein